MSPEKMNAAERRFLTELGSAQSAVSGAIVFAPRSDGPQAKHSPARFEP